MKKFYLIQIPSNKLGSCSTWSLFNPIRYSKPFYFQKEDQIKVSNNSMFIFKFKYLLDNFLFYNFYRTILLFCKKDNIKI